MLPQSIHGVSGDWSVSATTDTANEHNRQLVLWCGDCGPLLGTMVTLSQLLKLPKHWHLCSSFQFSHSLMSDCEPMDCSTPGLLVHHQLPEFTQTHVRWVGDAIQPYPLSFRSPPAFDLSQHQGLFKWVSSSHQVSKTLQFQLQHQFFQWTPRTDI